MCTTHLAVFPALAAVPPRRCRLAAVETAGP